MPADNVTCAFHGVHGLSVLTGVMIADSMGAIGLERISDEQFDDQARCLLEDMPIKSIKVGHVPSPDIAAAIAGIAADYGDAPMVLQLPPAEFLSINDDSELDLDSVDPCVGSVLELLVPQARVVVMPFSATGRWLNDEVLDHFEGLDRANSLRSLGADWVLTTGFVQRPGSLVHLLQGPDGLTVSLPCEPSIDRVQDISDLVATALACELALGAEVTDAAKRACLYAHQAAASAFQAGMGRKIANRWPPQSESP